MNVLISRFGSLAEFGTTGILRAPSLVCYTFELPWLNNLPGKSCVPAGVYQLEHHSSANHPDTWALVNHDLGVSHHATPGIPRNEILLHSVGFVSQLEGCIGMSNALGFSMGQMAMTNSKATFEKLRQMLAVAPEPHTVTILGDQKI